MVRPLPYCNCLFIPFYPLIYSLIPSSLKSESIAMRSL